MEDLGTWIALGASLGVGLLIGLERERRPSAKAGVRTFALVALAGTLAAMVGERIESAWLVPLGLAAVVAMLVAAYARGERQQDPGTTTVIAAAVCYLLGVLAGLGEAALAGALGIGVTALLYFKPELEGVARLRREEQVSVLQFLVVTFIVLPILPDRGFGPYEVLNPRHIWLMVVLIAGIGLASYVMLRLVGGRHGVWLTGVLGGMVSSTATTVLYARRSRDSEADERMARVLIPVANLMPFVRPAVLTAILAPGLLPTVLPPLAVALGVGAATAALLARRAGVEAALPVPEMRNPTEMGTAIVFGGLYAAVLLASAWLSDVAGDRGLYAVALASGLVDIDAIVLSSLNLFDAGSVPGAVATVAIGAALASNTAFKMGVTAWFNRCLAARIIAPFAAAHAAGAAVLAFS